jgi:exodeoxyribonuclease V alpha subunit
MPETLRGTVERVTFFNPDNGFAVLKVNVAGRRELVTVVGTISLVTAGEYVEASGQWVVDREHGPQFKASELQASHPSSAEGIERYLGSGAVRGIGPHLAAKIVGIYKDRALEIIDRSSDMLLHIRGIGQHRLARIRDSWRQQKEIRRIMLFLHELGIGSGSRAVRIYKTYGQDAIAKIRANPYQLADDVRGIGFKTADQLAGRLGIDPQSPARARAAVRYALQQLSQEGHCGFPEQGVLDKTQQLVGIDSALLQDAVESELTAGNLIREPVADGCWLFLTGLHRAETGLAYHIRRLARDGAHPLPDINLEKALEWVQQRLDIELAPGQREAVRLVCRHPVVVITGGPGVGKTTLVKSILEIFTAKKLKCVLAAPTGRAAKRLAETTGRTARTIHRLLEFDPATGDFKRNQKHPLKGDLFVLDETSMVDVFLAFQILRAIPDRACVVLVGDVDQLPSVGPGRVLADLIASHVVPVARLTEVFRQAAQSRIVTSAYNINSGQLPRLTHCEELEDFYFLECEEPESIQNTIVRLVRERIPDRFAMDPLTDIQVLAPMNRSPLGARHLNQVLQEALNPPAEKPEIQRYGWTFRQGDRVIQTENNYSRDVFNGDLGIITKINRVDQELTVDFEGAPVVYDFSDLDELALAYVLSIHKSQGSEYPCVIIPLHTQHYMMLQRNLLYTAVTRGKRLVIIVGSKRALRMAVARKDTQLRCTMLERRLAGTPLGMMNGE